MVTQMNEMKIYIHHKNSKVDFMPTTEASYYEEIQVLKEDGWRQVIIDNEICQSILFHYFLNKQWAIESILVKKHNEMIDMKEFFMVNSLAEYVSESKRDRGFFAAIVRELSRLDECGFFISKTTLSKDGKVIEFTPNGVCKFTDDSADEILNIVSDYLLKGEMKNETKL